ncbi:hypothetical protein CPter291_0644 [Collimonas pratensis]|jgi:hypothetical protein|uniref:Uncharacterized protein n=1 Tax=Collimonas pratensis TaxID=279113 RepID=A0A127QS89_9BURK|nr:hypothetical protein CPter91_0723 [Collimonas pratensis]AMP12928.1 hypothetical protein CPter291_0644 [Collimonas pratensis]
MLESKSSALTSLAIPLRNLLSIINPRQHYLLRLNLMLNRILYN